MFAAWLPIVLFGHIATALSLVLSRLLLKRDFESPLVFTFFIGVLGMGSWLAAPWFIDGIDVQAAVINILAGVALVPALGFSYYAIQHAEVSRIVPFIDAGIPLTSLFLETVFLGVVLGTWQYVGIGVLVCGAIIITRNPRSADEKKVDNEAGQAKKAVWRYALLSAMLFSVSFVLSKVAFNDQVFESAFIWIRLGSFLAVLPMLLFTKLRNQIISAAGMLTGKVGLMYGSTQLLGAAGFIAVNYAISVTSVAVVNALQSAQYVALMIMSAAIGAKYPDVLEENFGGAMLWIKVIGAACIATGVVLLTLQS